MNCVPERNKCVSASLHEAQFVYDWTALISCLCPPAGSQAVTIDSMSCEVISSSSSAAHAVRQKDDCTVIILAIIFLLLFIFSFFVRYLRPRASILISDLLEIK